MTTSAGRRNFHSPVRQEKIALRHALLDARRERPRAAGTAASALADAVQSLPEVATADTVAAYVSVGSEPPTRLLLDRLLARSGTTVLVPVLLADDDLDWVRYEGPAGLVASRRGLETPAGPRLGRMAVGAADVVIVPGLAAGADGRRLGRGGGSYDRALRRVGASALVVLLLWDGELLDRVPAEPHDRSVDVVVTPTAVRRFTAEA